MDCKKRDSEITRRSNANKTGDLAGSIHWQAFQRKESLAEEEVVLSLLLEEEQGTLQRKMSTNNWKTIE